MKIDYRRAIQRAIIDQPDQTGHTWKVTAEGMAWSYGVEFTFNYTEFDTDEGAVWVEDKNSHMTLATIAIGPTRWDDTNDIEKAYYMAARATIIQANYLY